MDVLQMPATATVLQHLMHQQVRSCSEFDHRFPLMSQEDFQGCNPMTFASWYISSAHPVGMQPNGTY
jgi:hypothetical protein